MKKNIIYIAMFVIAFFLIEDSLSSNQLNAYLLKYKNIKTFQGKFIQKKHISIMSSDQISYGQIKFKKKDKLLWSLEKPYLYKFIINGKIIVKDYPQLHEREKYNIDENIQLKALFDNIFLLMGLKSMSEIKKKYTIQSSKNSVILIPKNKRFKKYINKIKLRFNKRNLIESIKLFEATGNYTLIQFTDIKLDQPISDSEFSVD